MGGDANPAYVDSLAKYLHSEHSEYKVGWYSGRQRVPTIINKKNFDYIKLGPYLKHLGCLKDKTTNQRLYKRAVGDDFTDITSRFWRK
jgi:anaerobic ribonucleoside-triphosphate reductase activating protein